MLNIYIASQSHYLEPFKDLFQEVWNIKGADVVMFTGGADVSPRLYNEPVGQYTSTNWNRDQNELEIFEFAVDHGIKMLGICRGSQFLTVMAGGKLVQDVTDHGRSHAIYSIECPELDELDKPFDYINGQSVIMSSTHHQMMHPYNLDEQDYDILAYARHRSKHYLNGHNQPIPHSGIEPEIVWYQKIKALAIQGHPEIMDFNSSGVQYCRSLIKEYFNV